jgi:hypothetical protein
MWQLMKAAVGTYKIVVENLQGFIAILYIDPAQYPVR